VSCKLCLDCNGKIGSVDLVCAVCFPSWILLDLSCCLFLILLVRCSSISGGFCFPFGFCAGAATAARESPHRQPVVRPALISSACARYFSRGWFFGRCSVRSSRAGACRSAFTDSAFSRSRAAVRRRPDSSRWFLLGVRELPPESSPCDRY
jgi:hypothetical protein